jgi:sterol desaturase/sphingolipid hydroxylase (fatty acid hydroxylase superfamily)
MDPEIVKQLSWLKPSVAIILLAVFWSWETWLPFFQFRKFRIRHALHNLGIAILNTIVLGLVFGAATVWISEWTVRNKLGLLPIIGMPWYGDLIGALMLLDLWMYVWHRANHQLPVLWRFHRMHHADNAMDVTTATRFHVGEHLMGSLLRLGLIPLFGIGIFQLVIYEALVVAITMFHHANISIGYWDDRLRWLVVTPFMHKVHHSRLRAETDSNYSTLFSFWDRLFGSLRKRTEYSSIQIGLDEFDDPRWQTFSGMIQTPFTTIQSDSKRPSQ